ncbi:hypothetical protein BO78DRAFT_449004 [Aspergillus sclerotiicarbonarius CBS 121057]|uniref:Amino acid transporter transmembrane domain-containing protein n=1 Tax=Aspergillus sclerotiicarbonarius (strain CBS 121057 / IBT 28362) TaxID=1448318 RepID=A0A319EM63_ASPSB|nr:hypothetical protein BO78DRAFT_449004 [Aspergillus sclerotiicarbonarius CBS 121057]
MAPSWRTCAGVAVIVGVGIPTTYTRLVIGEFKYRYAQAHSMADAGNILWGRFGCEILGAAQLVFFTFSMGSHILTFSIMVNVLSGHLGCTVLFTETGALLSFVLTISRRLESLSFLSPITYPNALALLYLSEMTLYTVTAIVIYKLVGPDVASPSLNPAGPLFREISYGIAVLTIMVAGVVNAHVAVKSIYVRMFRGRNAMHSCSFRAMSQWAAVCAIFWFSGSLSVSQGFFWLHLHARCGPYSWKQTILIGFNYAIVAIGVSTLTGVWCIFGVYSSITPIQSHLSGGAVQSSFSCADNS